MARSSSGSKDWLVLGVATGVAASVAKSLLNLALGKAGVPTVQYGPYAGGWMLGRRNLPGNIPGDSVTPGEHALGWLAETIYGGIFGAGISYVISKTPPGHEVVKGMIGGATLWATIIGSLNQLDRPRHIAGSQLTTMLGMNLFYGALQGALLRRFGSQGALKQPAWGTGAAGLSSVGGVSPFVGMGAVALPPAQPGQTTVRRLSRHLKARSRNAAIRRAAHHPAVARALAWEAEFVDDWEPVGGTDLD